VFRSYDPQRDRLIAVKAFKIDIVPEDARRFAEALRPLCDGPAPDRAIVRLFETGLSGSTAFVAMEFATGESLDVALRHLAPAPIDQVLPMLSAIAEAIDAAWRAGLGHGALHPRDVIVAPGTLDLRITGFGIVPALESIGVTPPVRRPYSAPERAAGAPWDVRADVYSLGVIAHELLTGRRPLGSGEPDRATPMHQILAGALAASPDDRYESAAAFVDALADAAARGEAQAGPPADGDGLREPRDTELPEADEPGSWEIRIPASAAPVGDLEFAREREEPAMAGPRVANARAEAAPEVAPSPERPRYPLGVLAAVALAGVAVGTVLGYALAGRSSAEAALAGLPPPESAVARAETEVDVAPPPTPPPAEVTPPAAPPPALTAAAPPDPVERPVRAAAVSGRLVIRSVPAGALVTIDGRRLGETPVTARDLTLGAHAVQIARPGFVPETRRVTLTTREPAQTLTVALTPGAEARTATTGAIYAETRPRGARVFVDGREVGTTPLVVPELRPGPHLVRFELAGHAPSSSSVVVKAGERARIAVSLVRR